MYEENEKIDEDFAILQKKAKQDEKIAQAEEELETEEAEPVKEPVKEKQHHPKKIQKTKDKSFPVQLSPHPLSFMKLQVLCLFLIIWGIVIGWIVNFSEYKGFFENEWLILIAWGLVLLLVGVIASLITVQWSILFAYLSVFIGAVILVVWQNWIDKGIIQLFIPFYSVGISILAFLFVEFYRRSHKYFISNTGISFKGGIFTKRERSVNYDKITDIVTKQSIIGQMFGFGTIIPVSQSGFGLGSDKSFAAGGIEVGGKKAKALGIIGGGRDVQTPMSKSYYELHGVYPYKEIKKIVEEMVQGTVIIPYQQEQVKFQKEQVDLQKEMRDLLKLQNGSKKKDDEE